MFLILTYRRYTTKQCVAVVVGAQQKTYYLYPDLLKAESPFIAAQLKKCWNPKKDKIEIKNADPNHFDKIVHWLYTELVPETLPGVDSTGPAEKIHPVYKLADELMMVALQNDLMDKLILYLRNSDTNITFYGLAQIAKLQLQHTPLYLFALKNVTRQLMICPLPDEEMSKQFNALVDSPDTVRDVLLHLNQ